MTKKNLRKLYKEKRASLTEALIDLYSIEIANNLLKIPIWEQKNYHLFLPISSLKEVNTEYVLHILSGKDKHIILSKTNFEVRKMTHFLLTEQTKIHTNAYGIPEPDGGFEISPQQIEVVFIPLLAYDIYGNRVGYGKGFYDDFLKECPKETLKIGLSFFEPAPLISDISENDIPLNYCVTPQKNYQF